MKHYENITINPGGGGLKTKTGLSTTCTKNQVKKTILDMIEDENQEVIYTTSTSGNEFSDSLRRVKCSIINSFFIKVRDVV